MAGKNSVKTIPYYMIISKCSGMALDVMEESARMFYALDTPLQHWSFEDRGNGCVSIINRGTHQVLDVDMAGVENGTPVHLWQDINAMNQLWILEEVGNDTYRLKARHSGRYLDICGQSLSTGANLNIWESTSSDTQLWIIREVSETPKIEEAPKPPKEVVKKIPSKQKTVTRKSNIKKSVPKTEIKPEPQIKTEPEENN